MSKKDERDLGEGADIGDGEVIVTDEADRAKAGADALLADGEEDQMVLVQGNADQTSICLPGKKEIVLDKKKQAKVAIRHVPTLRHHGFEVVKIIS